MPPLAHTILYICCQNTEEGGAVSAIFARRNNVIFMAQEPYNLFAQQKQQYYPNARRPQQVGSSERPSYEEWYNTVPSDRNDTSNYNLRRAYELAPMDELERWRTASQEQLKNDESYHLKSMYFDPKTGVGEFMKSKNHPTLQGELDFYYGNSPQSKEFRDKYDLDKSGDYYRYVPRMQATTPQNYSQGNGAVMAGGTQYGQQTGGVARTTQPIRSMDDLVSAMYTDPQQEEKLRKASVANQRIMAVGDALRHIGNIFNTVNYAPSQQFNKPWEEERNRYLQEKAYRDKRNQIYMTYQQQKAAQDAKIAQAERQFQYNAAKDARDYELKKNESEARQQRQNALAAIDKARLEGQLDKNTYQRLVNQYYPENAQARINEIESRIAKNNRTGGERSGGSGGSKMPNYTVTDNVEWLFNENGERIGSKSTKTRTVEGRGQETKTNVGNFSIRGKKKKEEQKKTNVGNFSIHK